MMALPSAASRKGATADSAGELAGGLADLGSGARERPAHAARLRTKR